MQKMQNIRTNLAMYNSRDSTHYAPKSGDNDGWNSLRLYVKQTLRQRECNTLIVNKEKKGECQCGREVKRHKCNITTNSPDKEWNADSHTVAEACTSFGRIQFKLFGQETEKNAMYVRVEHDTRPEHLWTLMEKHWRLQRPEMLISVTGGAKLSLKPRLKESFKRGLIDVTTSTGAWIVTGGTNAGVMALVGEAVSDYSLQARSKDKRIVCIGFATWGIVKNSEVLDSHNGEGKFPAQYTREQLQTIEGKSSRDQKEVSPLDHNHTHFILVDNGTVNSYGAEIKLRAAMEKHISEQSIASSADDKEVRVPIVLLVVDGGDKTLKTVVEALRIKTPVVIIGSSGRAANFIEAGMRLSKNKLNEDEALFPDNFEKEMNAQAQKYFELKSDDTGNIKKCFDLIKEIVDTPFRQLINIFKLDDGEGNIDQAILYALFRARKSDRSDKFDVNTQLRLTLAWNRSDIARDEIFENGAKDPVESSYLHSLLSRALQQDRVEFVKLFLENGVKLDTYLTPKKLAELYEDARTLESSNAAASLLQIMNTRITNRNPWIKDRENGYLRFIGCLLDDLFEDEFKFNQHYKEFTKPNNELNPYRELLIWALLLNRKEMAMLFWRSGKDHIGGALVASAICKSLSKKADSVGQIDLSSELRDHSQYFEQLAQGVLNECFLRDKDITHKLLVRQLTTWQHMTLLSIAASAEQMDFIGHTACQTKLNYIWRGKIIAYTSKFKLLGALFLPSLIWSIKFAHDDPDNVKKETNVSTNNQVAPSSEHVDQPPSPLTSDHKTTGTDTNTGRKSHSCMAPYLFYTAPMVKFSYDILSQLVYLGLFSYFVLVDLQPLDSVTHAAPAVTEWVIWAWTATLFMEQIRKIMVQEPENIFAKITYYFDNMWAYFDLLLYTLFIISIILRCTLYGEDFMWARIVYCCTLGMFFIHFMYIFYVERNIGPKVIIIRLMMKDLLFFGLLWVIFLFSYGVMMEALRLPGVFASWERLERIIFNSYWQMFNIIDPSVQSGVYDACGNATDPALIPPECQQMSGFIMFACAVYSLLTAILLLNMLIAMFSFTFSRVQENSEKIWRFYRYGLIYDYFERPALAPPLIVFSHMWRCARYFYQRCGHQERMGHDFYYVVKDSIPDGTLDFILSQDENQRLTAFERTSTENFMREKERQQNLQLESQVTTASQRVNYVLSQLESVKEQLTDAGLGCGGRTIQDHFNDLQDQMFAQQQQLNLIVNMLKDTGTYQQDAARSKVEVTNRYIDVGQLL